MLHLVLIDGQITLGNSPCRPQSWCLRYYGQSNISDFWWTYQKDVVLKSKHSILAMNTTGVAVTQNPNHLGYLCNLWSSCRELQCCHVSWTSFNSIVCPCKKGVQWDNYYCINRIWATNADAPYANYKWYIKLTSKSSLGLLFTPHPSSKSRLCTHSNSVIGARFQWNQNMRGWRRWSCDGSLTAPE